MSIRPDPEIQGCGQGREQQAERRNGTEETRQRGDAVTGGRGDTENPPNPPLAKGGEGGFEDGDTANEVGSVT